MTEIQVGGRPEPVGPSDAGTRFASGAQAVRSVYLHAPFCARRCFYCDFAVKVRRTGDLDGWMGALGAELELRRAAGIQLADRLDTLYVGGGTPSLMGPDAMARVRGLVGPDRLVDSGLEWTSEANPESLTPALAEAWRAAGTNRLSLGVQSFQPAVLRWMGRLHGAEGAVRAVRAARDAGFDEISIDLIFGLPDASEGGVDRDWTADLERTLELGVPHVSLYGLTVEKGTGLARGVEAGRVGSADEERYRDEYLEAHERLTASGYRHYEVSNFALPGSESRHNRAYWDGSAYLGLGNGAHSFLPPRRMWNLRGWDDYLQRVLGGGDPTEESELVMGGPARLERLWTALRTDRGLDPAGLDDAARDRIRGWIARGHARDTEGRVALTPEGWLLLDSLTLDLDAG